MGFWYLLFITFIGILQSLGFCIINLTPDGALDIESKQKICSVIQDGIFEFKILERLINYKIFFRFKGDKGYGIF